MDLTDFNPSTSPSNTLDDFMMQRPRQQAVNPATATNIAAHAAVLTQPTEVLKSYGTINTELSEKGHSPLLDRIMKEAIDVDRAAAYTELNRILSDPNIPQEDKAMYMDGYISMANDNNQSRSLSVLVAQSAAEQPIGVEENQETLETTTFNLGQTLDAVDEYRGWAQQQLNMANGLKDQDWVNTTVDFIEFLFPFMDQASVAKTRSATGGDFGALIQSMLLAGDSKAAIRDAIRKMPVEARREAAQKLIDIVKQTGGSITIRPNELNMINQLTDYLDGNAYMGGDQLIDNFFSVLDAAFPLGKLLKVGKGAGAVGDISRAEKVAERQAQAAVDEVVIPAVNPELDNIINGTRAFDKATAEEIANARNTIGYGLADGKSIDEIIASDPVFDKFTSEELAEFRSMVLARTEPPVPDSTVDAMRDMISDRVVDGLSQLDEVPYEKIAILREEIRRTITRGAIQNPKSLSRAVINTTKTFLRNNQLQALGKETTAQLIKDLQEKSNLIRSSTKSPVAPTSLSQTMATANPGKARSVNRMMEADPTDQTAQSLYGTTRTNAIANDRLPEVGNIDGSVRNKVSMDEGPNPDKTTIDNILGGNGRIDLERAEKDSMRQRARDAFKNVVGLTPRRSMGTIGRGAEDTPSGVAFDMVYGPSDGGFKSAKQGLEQILFGLRKYGVTSKDVEILSIAENGNYIPVKGLPLEDGNYLVRVKYDYEFSPGDVVEHTFLSNSKLKMFESRTNWTDGNAGGLTQHFIPASAVINKVVYNSASVAADKTARYAKELLTLGEVYAKHYKKVGPKQQALIDAYRIEANEKGIPFNASSLRARGFEENSIETLRAWKNITDTMWYLENIDLNKTLRAKGWERFVDQVHDSDLIARRVSQNSVSAGVKAYDPELNQIRALTPRDVKELYEKQGTVAQVRSPFQFGDDTVEYVISLERSDGSYLRRINVSDSTLPYRDGYYPVKYDAPIFITKKFKKKDGTEYRKAVATAGSLTDANRVLERMRATDPEGDYVARPDLRRGTDSFEDAEWEAIVASGRSAQRIRGQRLEDGSKISDLNHVHVESPEESLVTSIRSLAARTAFRDWSETTKARWLEQYKGLLEKPLWPTDVRDIGKNNLELSSTQIKDAKATWRYVNAIENGYANLLDDVTKNFFNSMSDTSGRSKSFKWLEKPLSELSTVSPSAYARKKAFRFLLAANPARQLPVQALQALPVLLATNPLAIPKIANQMILLDFLANGGDAGTFMKIMAKTATGMNVKDAEELAKAWRMSGFEDAVEAHTLIRDQLNSLVDRTALGRARTLSSKPIDVLQKVGFNLGETILMRSIWLSEYDLLKKSGKKIDAEAIENLNARVRNLTLNMNRAGEMPYNENLLSPFMQFFQAPHKAFSQVLLGHTGLSKADRLKLGASYVLTYGIGGGFITDTVVKAIGQTDPQTTELVEGGIFNLLLNNALSTIYGEEVRTDFSDSLRLLDQDLLNFFEGMLTNSLGDTLSASPSLSLVFGSNPRLTTFVKQMMRAFTVDNERKPEELSILARNFFEIFSGGSNFFRAKYALEYGKTISNKGAIIDPNVNSVEAFLKVAGFSTMDEIHKYAADEASYKASSGFKEDVKMVVDEISARLADKDISQQSANWWIDMMSEAQRVFNNDPVYLQEFADQIRFKAMNGDFSLFNRLLEQSGYMDAQQWEKMVRGSNLDESAKETLFKVKRTIEGTR